MLVVLVSEPLLSELLLSEQPSRERHIRDKPRSARVNDLKIVEVGMISIRWYRNCLRCIN